MFNQIMDTNNYHTQSAIEIDQRVRQREEKRRWLEAEYGQNASETPENRSMGWITLLTSLFAVSI